MSKPLPAALAASLARSTRKANARPSHADAARAFVASTDALPGWMATYYQGSIVYSHAQMVAEGREIVLDGTEAPTRGR